MKVSFFVAKGAWGLWILLLLIYPNMYPGCTAIYPVDRDPSFMEESFINGAEGRVIVFASSYIEEHNGIEGTERYYTPLRRVISAVRRDN